MEWRDEAIVLGTRPHGETAAILEAMTKTHGRHLGLVHGGRSRRLRPVLQPGNRLDLTWRARVDEQMGTFQAEPIELNAGALMESAVAVFALQTLAAHLRLLPERDPHPALFEALGVVLGHLDEPALAGALAVRFEALMLDELGFGLDLTECAITGANDRLAYVSPRTGRAVSQSAAEPWLDKLLPLPAFLLGGERRHADFASIADGFRLTGHFLDRNVYEPRGQMAPESRESLIGALKRALDG